MIYGDILPIKTVVFENKIHNKLFGWCFYIYLFFKMFMFSIFKTTKSVQLLDVSLLHFISV